MAETNNVILTAAYTGTDFERTYNFAGVSSSYLSGIENAVVALNGSIAGGTDGGFKEFFRSDDYDDSDSSDIIGELQKIRNIRIETTRDTVIF